VFLPNNYRDIEGGTGKITNIFTLGNNLYIHTQHALWHQPQSFQERITQDIISFIGTGSYFAIPPRKIVDDENNSAGTEHKWGMTKTPYGVVFPCEVENKWYFFNGEKLEPLSSEGNSNWFRQNMKFLVEEDYYNRNLKPYPFRDNPVNTIGAGYVSAYDSTKDRLLLTKKDYAVTNFPEKDFELCDQGNGLIIFENVSETIAEKEEEGFTFEGIENCRLKFSRVTYEETIRQGFQQSTLRDSDYIVIQLDYSGSFGNDPDSPIRMAISQEIQKWYNSLGVEEPGEITYTPPSIRSTSSKLVFIPNNVTITHPVLRPNSTVEIVNNSERSLLFPYAMIAPLGPGSVTGWNDRPDFADKKVVYLSFVNESSLFYHPASYPSTVALEPTEGKRLVADYETFLMVQSSFSSFSGILYPIVFSTVFNPGRSLVRTYLSIYKKYNTFQELLDMFAEPGNSAFPLQSDLENMYNDLLLNNNYLNSPALLSTPLQELGWFVKPDKYAVVTIPQAENDSPITAEDLAQDVSELLSTAENVEEEVEYISSTPNYEVVFVDGVIFEPETLNNSWTISYSLKEKGFVSWHSYFPSYYISETEKFYSWYKGLSHIYKHNKLGSHGYFYGNKKPFIIEFVINDQAVLTKIQDYLKFQSSCQVYDTENKMYKDVNNTTFNKLLVYNSYQTSSVLNLITKSQDVSYLNQQVSDNNPENIFIERYEKDWHINGLRDYRNNQDIAFFSKSLELRQEDYYIDKVVNPLAINFNKNWFEITNFRDKFLVVRLIYDNFADVKLTMEFTVSEPKISE
jgi:hypothetical protein